MHDLYLLGTNSLSYEASTQYATCICQGLIVSIRGINPVHDLYLSWTNRLSYDVSTQCTTCTCQGQTVYHTRYRPSTRLVSVMD